jgi:hypothetical protein
LLVVVLVVSLVGLVVVHQQPSNVIGWLLLGAAGVFASMRSACCTPCSTTTGTVARCHSAAWPSPSSRPGCSA